MGHQVIKLQNPLKTLGFLQFYRFKTVKDRNITGDAADCNIFRQILEREVPSCNYLSPDRGNLTKSKLKLCFDLAAASKR